MVANQKTQASCLAVLSSLPKAVMVLATVATEEATMEVVKMV